jgi:hypothetical protein
MRETRWPLPASRARSGSVPPDVRTRPPVVPHRVSARQHPRRREPLVRPNHRRHSRARRAVGLRRGTAVVVVQEAAEALAARDRPSGIGVIVGRRGDRRDQSVVEALVVALDIVMLDELRDREPKVALAEGNEFVEAFALDREHEAFRKRVQIGLRAGSLRHLTPARIPVPAV